MLVVFAALSLLGGCKHVVDSDTDMDDSGNVLPVPVVLPVVSGLREPVALAFLSPTHWVVAERQTGYLRWIDNGKLRAMPFAVLAVPDLPGDNEGGLCDLALDPGYPVRPFLFASYTTANGGKPAGLRIVRFTVNEKDGTGGAPLVIIDKLPVSVSGNDIGGKLLFGADGKLYVTLGDNERPEQAQDYQSLAGKVLRYNPDGTVPGDNPLEDAQTASAENSDDDAKQLEGTKTPVYTLGQRDPLGITLNQENGKLYLTDAGPGHDDVIEHLVAADNYGWPLSRGANEDPRFHPPLWSSGNRAIVPTGMAFYTGMALPQYQGNLFFTSRNDGKLRRVILHDPDAVTAVQVIPQAGDHARLTVVMGADGDLYFSSMDSIYKLTAQLRN